MDESRPNMEQEMIQPVSKPTSVTVFGVLNIVVGCYVLVRMGHSWYRIIPGIVKNSENIITFSEILVLLLGVVGVALAVWLVGLGVGLLAMKGWARRGSIIYSWIQIVFMIITLGATFISLITTLFSGWQDFLRVFWGTMNIGNGIVAIQWIYMILLLIFMKTEKIKRAFSAVGR